jgi:hypothetical protein
MGDWLHHIALRVKARTGFGPALIVWFVTAAILLVVALVFLCVAAFVWLANRYDGAIAGLLLGVFFFCLPSLRGSPAGRPGYATASAGSWSLRN